MKNEEKRIARVQIIASMLFTVILGIVAWNDFTIPMLILYIVISIVWVVYQVKVELYIVRGVYSHSKEIGINDPDNNEERFHSEIMPLVTELVEVDFSSFQSYSLLHQYNYVWNWLNVADFINGQLLKGDKFRHSQVPDYGRTATVKFIYNVELDLVICAMCQVYEDIISKVLDEVHNQLSQNSFGIDDGSSISNKQMYAKAYDQLSRARDNSSRNS